jgi:hypothetical protein
MKRPVLNEIPLNSETMRKFRLTVTMSIGQWDGILAASYDRGATLLELDDYGAPIKAYRRKIGADDG